LSPYLSTLWGGDLQRGRTIFRYHNAQCIRCHAVDGDGGRVGPDLRGVPDRIGHRALLESLILPNAVIAKGYGTSVITLKDGSCLTGSLLSQSTATASLRLSDGSTRTVLAQDIASMSPPLSAMPPMGSVLSLEEMRDLIAYLSSLH
jgi:quinoprotein glucose dehydrogenase